MAGGLSTKQFEKAGMSFEMFLKYSQLSAERAREFEKLFAKKYPKLVRNPVKEYQHQGKELVLTPRQIKKAGFPWKAAYDYSKMNDEKRKQFEKQFAKDFPKIYKESIRGVVRKTIKSEIYNTVVESMMAESGPIEMTIDAWKKHQYKHVGENGKKYIMTRDAQGTALSPVKIVKEQLREISSRRKQIVTESTNASVGTVLPGGKIMHIYIHWDGYPDHVGALLKKHYSNPALIRKLLQLGDISSLDKTIGKKHDFSDHDTAQRNGWTTFYGRDRGESGVSAEKSKNVEEFLNTAYKRGAEFAYLFDPQKNKWIYTDHMTGPHKQDWRTL